jgi:hypothetical protein
MKWTSKQKDSTLAKMAFHLQEELRGQPGVAMLASLGQQESEIKSRKAQERFP